eukprot:2190916-Pleurochrysis_carterae.AAC.1
MSLFDQAKDKHMLQNAAQQFQKRQSAFNATYKLRSLHVVALGWRWERFFELCLRSARSRAVSSGVCGN